MPAIVANDGTIIDYLDTLPTYRKVSGLSDAIMVALSRPEFVELVHHLANNYKNCTANLTINTEDGTASYKGIHIYFNGVEPIMNDNIENTVKYMKEEIARRAAEQDHARNILNRVHLRNPTRIEGFLDYHLRHPTETVTATPVANY